MEHTERVKQEFTRQADTFATAPAVTDEALTRRCAEAMGEVAGGRILDVACGPGILTAALAGIARAVVAFDLTPEMLEKARQRCSHAGRPNVTFEQGDATQLPFADAAFDGVITRLSVHHFQAPARAVAEMVRVLRPGGAFALADVISSEDREESDLHNAIEVLRDPSHTRMLAGSALRSLVTGAGLRIEADTIWDSPREFEEWMAIANEPARVAPLRIIARALARHGETAGIGLHLAGDRLAFFHRWALIRARKPS